MRLLRIFFTILLCSTLAVADPVTYTMTLKDHLFYPSKLTIPANKKVKLIIINLDESIEEFDSFDLNREKVLFPYSKTSIYIGPLPQGEYDFFGEYHPNSARGRVIAVEQGTTHVN